MRESPLHVPGRIAFARAAALLAAVAIVAAVPSTAVAARDVALGAARGAVEPLLIPASRPTGGGSSSATARTSTGATKSPERTKTRAPTTRMSREEAETVFIHYPKVAAWLHRYPPTIATGATYEKGIWNVGLWSGKAGEIASGQVDDASGAVIQAYTGPQVAWGMARGEPGAFGGKEINSIPVWLGFSAVFLIGLVDWRRLRSIRNLDLLMLLAPFTISLWFFNHGHIFAAMPPIYPAFAWLIGRGLWIAHRNRPPRGSVVWSTWLLIAATIVLIGFRIDLNVQHSNVIDVGLSGVIGADRIAHFVDPYGSFPVEGGRPPCGPADASGEIRDHIQTNGRCEAADQLGDTYGPVAYESYLPAYGVLGWSGLWDSLPTAHATTVLFDLLCILGLFLVGRRLDGPRLGVILAFAWAAWPFTQYASSSNTNDLIGPTFLVWAFYFLTAPFKRGAFVALSAWTKLAPLLVVPLWSGYPEAAGLRLRRRYAAGFLVTSALAFSILLFDRSIWHGAETFFHETIGYQYGRSSPFSIWDWGQYHAKGLPDLHWVQRVLEVALVIGSLALFRWPRQRSPLRIAAYTSVVLVGFEAVLVHWSWLYLPWFFPFAAYAILAPRRAEPHDEHAAAPALLERFVPLQTTERQRRLVGAGVASIVFLACWSFLTHWFYAHPAIADTGVYHGYVASMLDGRLPYRDFAVAYAPGSLPAFYLPFLIGGGYYSAFSWMMAACGVVCIVLVALSSPSSYALPFLAVSPLLVGTLGSTHFELWPAVFVTGALVALMKDRHRLGFGLLGAACTIELVPIVLVPLAAIWTIRRRGREEAARCAGVFAATAALLVARFVVAAPGGVWQSFKGDLVRPLQIETLVGAFARTFGHPRIVETHGSLNLAGYGAVAVVTAAVLGAVLVTLWVRFSRGAAEPGRLARYAAACICAFLILGEVLSPQLLVLLVPVVALVRGRRGTAAISLLTVILVATLVYFPNRYYSFVADGHLAWLVLVRDLMLLGLLLVLTATRLDLRSLVPSRHHRTSAPASAALPIVRLPPNGQHLPGKDEPGWTLANGRPARTRLPRGR
jgi:uncharacterized membrane protein